MSAIYELTVVREHIMERIQVDNRNIANQIFKEKLADKKNSIRARTIEHNRITSEKFFGEDPDWECMDEEWDFTEHDIKMTKESWDIFAVDTETKVKTDIDSCKSEKTAIDWASFHAKSNPDEKHVYLIEHCCYE